MILENSITMVDVDYGRYGRSRMDIRFDADKKQSTALALSMLGVHYSTPCIDKIIGMLQEDDRLFEELKNDQQ